MSLPRRALGIALFVVAASVFVAAARVAPTVPLAGGPESASLIATTPGSIVLTATLLAGGTILLLAAVAAIGGVSLPARVTLVAPIAGAVGAIVIGVDYAGQPSPNSGEVVVRAVETALAGSPAAVAAGAAVAGAVAPIVLGATRGDTVTLLAGSVLLLVALSLAPAPGLALLAGLGGGLAVGVAWGADRESWAP